MTAFLPITPAQGNIPPPSASQSEAGARVCRKVPDEGHVGDAPGLCQRAPLWEVLDQAGGKGGTLLSLSSICLINTFQILAAAKI